MILRRFYINLVIRIVLILLNMIVLAIIARDLFQKQLMFTFIVILIILIFQVVLLFSYIKKTNRLFTKFILTISNRDFATKFDEDYSKTPYKDLNFVFNKMLDQYHQVSKEKEGQYFLTKHLIDTIPVGILVFNESGKITFKNKLGEKLLGLNEIYSLTQLRNNLISFGEKIDECAESGSFLYESVLGDETGKVMVVVKSIELFNKAHKLISIHDVKKEVEAGELEAIRKLLRILTHEIMNSLTPINSLIETVIMLMSDVDGKEKRFDDFDNRNYSDVRESIVAIKERGEGLDHFVQNFRTLTKIPGKLKKQNIYVRDLFNSVCTIMNVEAVKFNIDTNIQDDHMQLEVDVALIEQVIINLLKNSLVAVSGREDPQILLKAFTKDNSNIIQVIDNGVGIHQSKIDTVFMPFYTTKEDGTGIGLSFARQIMNLHNGTIVAKSKLGETIFTLKF